MKNMTLIKALMALMMILGLAGKAYADDPIYTGTFSNTALGGYDSVSYFVGDGAPIKGSDDFTTEWRGAKWKFASQANLDTFKAAPEQYAPQYGGHCAWAIAHGSVVKGDPKVYTLENGKLYLNYNKSINDKWTPRKQELIPAADAQYPELVDLP